jgi:hypothetical protein
MTSDAIRSLPADGPETKRRTAVSGVTVSNEELRTVRDAMRELNRMVELLERGETEKFVLTQRNQMRAVVVSVERFSEMEESLRELRPAA